MKAYLHTFGCRANQYDTEAVRAMIVASGGSVSESAADADVAVFNSCAVTAAAEADLRQAVRRTAARNARIRIVVMGCAAARDDGTIAALPAVTDVVGGADLPAVAASLGLDRGVVVVRTGAQTGSRALLRIQDGCDEHCTFCATTLARGANRSRPVEMLVDEANALAETHPEIVLTGIHIGSYGMDSGSSLGELVVRLVDEVPRVRLRLSSIEATEVGPLLAELLAGDPTRVAPHLHAPLQSGSDRVLKRMGRHWYTAQSYADAVHAIVGGRRSFALGADVISGFPGETDDDHVATLAFVRSLPFTYLHVFPYSARPGTAAERLDARVPARVAKCRAAELRAVADEMAASYQAGRAGGRADVVVVGEGAMRGGLTEDYLTVALDDASRPRRSRFSAELAIHGDRLVATERAPSGSR